MLFQILAETISGLKSYFSCTPSLSIPLLCHPHIKEMSKNKKENFVTLGHILSFCGALVLARSSVRVHVLPRGPYGSIMALHTI